MIIAADKPAAAVSTVKTIKAGRFMGFLHCMPCTLQRHCGSFGSRLQGPQPGADEGDEFAPRTFDVVGPADVAGQRDELR